MHAPVPISKSVFDAGQKLAAASPTSLTQALNQALSQFLGWPFQVASGFVSDAEGKKTDGFGTLIFTTSQANSVAEPLNIDSNSVGCVIDASENMDVEQLAAAYERIACAKRLKKSPAPRMPGIPHTTVTLRIIFTRQTAVPLETLGEELDRLNRQHPDREWTDMVVVLSKGTINYGVYFPGETAIGDFLPPAEGVSDAYSPPIYVIIVIKPTGAYTFNRMCSFVMAHLMIFSPGAKLPNWAEVLEGAPKQAMTLTGYQYNVSGHLMPVSRRFYNDRFIPPRPFRLEDGKGRLLSTLQFLPWQEGGVVLLKGKLPLEGLLVFLGKKAQNAEEL